MKKNYNLLTGVIALIIIVVAISLAGYFVSRPEAEIIQGEAEATEYRVSGKVPGRIERLRAKEGDTVHKGDTLIEIDSPEVRAKLAQAMAVKTAAEAQKNKAVTGARKEQIAGAYELWQQASIGEDIAKKSFDRVARLYEQQVISAQKFDEAQARYKASQAACAAAKSQYEMALNGARKEDREAAIALVNQANGALMEVESYLSELYLTAPADGEISAIFPKAGELVGQGSPIMTVIDLKDIWFTFNVREDMLKGMQTGKIVTIRIPALGEDLYKAKISYMKARESYATWRATKETGQFDAKTFEVRAVPIEEIDGLRPGMTTIIVSEKANGK